MDLSTFAQVRRWHLVVLAGLLAALYTVVERRYVAQEREVTLQAADGAMALATAHIERLGAVSLQADQLMAGDQSLEGDTTIVDAVKTGTGFGCTIFRGNERVATTAVAAGESGRALGTRANAEITQSVYRSGETFRGITETIGKEWVIIYVPLRGASGQIVGMLATFREFDDFVGSLRTFRLFLGGMFAGLFVLLGLVVELSLRRGAKVETQARELDDLNSSLEEKVRARTSMLAAAVAEAREHRETAEAANRAKSTFLANMSHELRTPLNAVIGYSEMLAEEAQERELAEFSGDLQKIHGAGRHLLDLISDILDISKIEAGRVELHLERVELAGVLRDVVATTEPLADRNATVVHADWPDDLGEVVVDATKLRQSLLNLLSNAAKFTREGTITFTVRRRLESGRAEVVFTVSDDGIGMAPHQLERIFAPFTQADMSTTRKYGGTGLGLAITRRFCELMGGSIEAHSEPGAGSTFEIVLPAEVDASVARRADPDAAVGRSGHMILAIDDDPGVLALLKRSLTREGFEVRTASTGPEGLAQARADRPDLITLDVMMPDMDGWAVLSALKSDPDTSRIPVVMVTVVDDKNLAFTLGAADYLMKPVDSRRLLRIAHRYLDSADDGLVLVVEDDEDSRELAVRTLTRAGFTTAQAANGREALDSLRAEVPDLIVLDLMMPVVDGFEVVSALRDDARLRDIPVVVLTAKELDEADRQRLTGHVERILSKGEFALDELAPLVRQMIRRSSES